MIQDLLSHWTVQVSTPECQQIWVFNDEAVADAYVESVRKGTLLDTTGWEFSEPKPRGAS